MRIVTVPEDWPDGWDLADPAPVGADLRAMLDTADPYEISDRTDLNQAIFPPGFVMRNAGLWWCDTSDADKPDLHIAGPFDVLAETRDTDGNAWGVLVRWPDHDGRQHEWALPRAMLAGDGTDARTTRVGKIWRIVLQNPNGGVRHGGRRASPNYSCCGVKEMVSVD